MLRSLKPRPSTFFVFACALAATTARPAGAARREARPPATAATAASIRALVESRQRDVRACYELALSQEGDAPGRVFLKWKVDDAGAAQDVEVDQAESTLTDPDLHQCIADKIKSWKFPSARRGKLVPASHSFVFSK